MSLTAEAVAEAVAGASDGSSDGNGYSEEDGQTMCSEEDGPAMDLDKSEPTINSKGNMSDASEEEKKRQHEETASSGEDSFNDDLPRKEPREMSTAKKVVSIQIQQKVDNIALCIILVLP